MVETIRSLAPVSATDRDALQTMISELLDAQSVDCGLSQAALLLGAPQMRSVRMNMRPPEGLSVVHETQRFWRAHAEGSAAMDVELTQEVTGQAARFAFRSIVEGDVVAEMETRLRFVEPLTMRALKGARYSERMAGAGAVALSLPPVGPDVVRRYVTLAHDDNPIHVDDVAARAAGLPKAVVPGMLLCALSEAAFGQNAGTDAQEIKTRFMAAVPVGAVARLIAVPRGHGAGEWSQARVFCVTEDDMIAAISDIRSQ